MHKTAYGLTALLLLVSGTLAAQEGDYAQIPDHLAMQIDKHMVGEWTFEGSWGENKFTGSERIRWTEDRTSVLAEGYELTDGKKMSYVSVVGWSDEHKRLLLRGFTSTGETWSGDWSEITDSQWKGTGTGTYQGVRWNSPATLDFKEDWQRYQDVTDGKKWVAVYIRKAKNLSGLSDLEWLIGSWKVKGIDPNDGSEFKGEQTWRWSFGKKNIVMSIATFENGKKKMLCRATLAWDPYRQEVVGSEYWYDGYVGTFALGKKDSKMYVSGEGVLSGGSRESFEGVKTVAADKQSFEYKATILGTGGTTKLFALLAKRKKSSTSASATDAAMARLREFIAVGTLTYEGETDAAWEGTEYGPAGKFSGKSTTRSVQGSSFLMEEWKEDYPNGDTLSGMIIYGYDAEKRRHFGDHYISNGLRSHIEVGFSDDHTMTQRFKQTSAQGEESLVRAEWKYNRDKSEFDSSWELSLDNAKSWKPWVTYHGIVKKK